MSALPSSLLFLPPLFPSLFLTLFARQKRFSPRDFFRRHFRRRREDAKIIEGFRGGQSGGGANLIENMTLKLSLARGALSLSLCRTHVAIQPCFQHETLPLNAPSYV